MSHPSSAAGIAGGSWSVPRGAPGAGMNWRAVRTEWAPPGADASLLTPKTTAPFPASPQTHEVS